MADYFEEMGWQPLSSGETPNHFLHLARLLRDYNMFEEAGQTQRLPPPATKESVQNLPDQIIQEHDIQCPVCLKYFSINDAVKQLPCKHLYHAECILPWLAKTNSCPSCRFELPTDDEDYEAYRKEKIRAKQRVEDINTLHNSMFS